jgi:predicted metal-dependent hydrolase
MAIARLDGAPPVDIVLRRSARARRYSLRVSRVDGRVTLTLPLRARASDALAFAREHEGWIRTRLAEMPAARRIALGGVVPVSGADRVITAAPVAAPELREGLLLAPERVLRRGAPGPGVAACLKMLARDRLETVCDAHARTLGRRHGGIVLRDTRSRWGSCSSSGRLMFSWRLIMAPPEVLEYVATHEVAHLAEMNHSAAFWAQVARLMPDYRPHRDWLRVHGPALHRVDFSG